MYGYEQLEKINAEKNKIFYDCIIKASEMNHIDYISKRKAQKANDAIISNDKKYMWDVMQDYFMEYADFINSLSCITKITAIQVSIEYYEKCNTNDFINQLQTIICFVYIKEVMNSAVKETFKRCLEKLLKERGYFS